MLRQKDSEKRDFPRMAIGTELTFNVSGENRTFKGFCKNLSHTGIQFETAEALPGGKLLEVVIDSKTDKFEQMKATINVIRVEQITDKQYSVAGEILDFN